MTDLFDGGAAAESNYSAQDIQVLEGLEAVRARPGMYICGTDEQSLLHLVAEIHDISLDEAVAGFANRIELSLNADYSVTVTDYGRGIPVDSHPKYPDRSALEVIMTMLHSGGKFGGNAYKVSGGLHGVGSSVVNALSESLTIEVARDRKLYRQHYANGRPLDTLEMVGNAPNRRGTSSTFRPDPEIFGANCCFSPNKLYRMARSKDFLFKGIHILWKCAPELLSEGDVTPAEAELHFPNGLRDFLNYQIGSRTTVNRMPFAGESLFVGTSNGVWQLSHALPGKKRQLLEGWNVQTLFCDKPKKELWIGTFGSGLSVMNLDTSKVLALEGQGCTFLHPIRAITDYDVHTILKGVDGGGVYAIDKDTKKARLLMNTKDDTDTYLRGNGVYAVTRDDQGNIWIGSYTGGVSVAILLKHPISILAHEKGNTHSLISNNVNDIEENPDGNQWFATDDGISIRNTLSGTWKHVLKEIVTISLCTSGNGNVWVGTYGDGVYLLDNNGRVLRHLTKQQGQLTTNYIFSVRQDMEGDLWIGGLDGCLIMFEKEKGSRRSFDVNWVQSIEPIDRNRVAVATVNGFFLVDKHTGNIQHYANSQEFHNQNVSAYIISMLFNDDGTVWLGTEGGGLNLYDMKNRTVKTFTVQEGLPSNDIYSLQRDDKKRLWVSTGKGIALIDSLRVSNLNYAGNID